MQYFQPGSIVAIDLPGPFKHVGIISDQVMDGSQMVISASRRKGIVAEETIMEFSDGKEVSLIGYPSDKSVLEVLRRAKSMIGAKYNLLKWNCEHFVRWVHGLRVESKQVQTGVGIAIVVTALFLLFKKK